MTSLVTFILSTVQCYIVLNFDDDMDDARKNRKKMMYWFPTLLSFVARLYRSRK